MAHPVTGGLTCSCSGNAMPAVTAGGDAMRAVRTHSPTVATGSGRDVSTSGLGSGCPCPGCCCCCCCSCCAPPPPAGARAKVLVTPDVLYRLMSAVSGAAASASRFMVLSEQLLTYFKESYQQVFSYEHPPLHDPCAVAYVVDPSIFKVVWAPDRRAIWIWAWVWGPPAGGGPPARAFARRSALHIAHHHPLLRAHAHKIIKS